MQSHRGLVKLLDSVYVLGVPDYKDLKYRQIIHARSTTWEGPMCRYRLGVVQQNNSRGYSSQCFRVTDDHSRVNCGQCLQRLGLKPKRKMPGQRHLSKAVPSPIE